MNNRNYTIDVLKAICAFLVVFIHTNYAYRGLILPITRCAVPCFFIISGYLLYREGGIGIERIKKNLSKILKITIWASIVFLIWEEVLYYFTHHECNIPTVDSITNWIIFNDYPFGFHLWYLYSFLYVLVLIIFIDRKNWWSLLYKLIPLCIVMVLVLGTYSSILFNVHIPYIYIRNFLFFGLPYFGLGAFLKKYETRILKSTLSSKPMILGGRFYF